MLIILYGLFIILQGDRIHSQTTCHSLVGQLTIMAIMTTDGIDIPIHLQRVQQGTIAWDGLPLEWEVGTTEVTTGEHN